VGRDGVEYRGDLGFRKTEIFLSEGLDRANQIDLVEEINFSAQQFLCSG
jgi:hypothetical protein